MWGVYVCVCLSVHVYVCAHERVVCVRVHTSCTLVTLLAILQCLQTEKWSVLDDTHSLFMHIYTAPFKAQEHPKTQEHPNTPENGSLS